MTIPEMQETINETWKQLDAVLEEMIHSYEDESECPMLCKALDAVVMMAESTDRGFMIMNGALDTHHSRC